MMRSSLVVHTFRTTKKKKEMIDELLPSIWGYSDQDRNFLW